MSGERGRLAGAQPQGDLAPAPRGGLAPLSPAKDGEERAHQDRMIAESLLRAIQQLDQVPRAEWAARKAALAQQLEDLRGQLRAPAGGATARADRDRGATAAAVQQATAALERATPPRVPGAVDGEDALVRALADKSLDKNELLDWFADLAPRDRGVLWRRYEQASSGQRDPRGPDEFARALANYVAAVRIRDDLQQLVHMNAHRLAGWRHRRRTAGARAEREARALDEDTGTQVDGPRGARPPEHGRRPPVPATAGASAASEAAATGGPMASTGSSLGSAAQAVSLAAGLAQTAIGREGPLDPDLARLRGALEALSDALHTHAGARALADERALTAAFRDADAVALRLATRLGPRSEAEVTLRRYLDFARRQAGQAEASHTVHHSPEALRTVAAGSVAALEQARQDVVAAPVPPAAPSVRELDLAIATTRGWAETLVSADRGEAARLSHAVLDQDRFLRTVLAELRDVLGRRITRSTPQVLEAYVHALARSTGREDQAATALARARRAAERQPLDLVDDALDASRAATADLAAADPRAFAKARAEDEVALRRKERLEAQLARGEHASGSAMDDAVLDAREQAFAHRVRSIDAQSAQLADALASMDDGVIGWLANGGDKILPLLVSDLHGLGRVVRAISERRVERTAAYRAEHGVELTGATPGWIAERAAALDQAEQRLDDWVATGHLAERMKAAHAHIETAQIRSLIVNIGAQLGLTLAGMGAARLASYGVEAAFGARAGAALAEGAEGAALAEGAGGAAVAEGAGGAAVAEGAGGAAVAETSVARVAATAGQVADLTVSTVGQRYVLGDRSSLLTLGLVNYTSMMVLGRLQAHFHDLDALVKETTEVSRVWGRVPELLQRGALQGVSISEELLLGAAVGYAGRQLDGHGGAAPTEQEGIEWLLQGASIALGRGLASRVQSLHEAIAARKAAGAADSPAVHAVLDRAAVVEPLAREAEATGSPAAGQALIGPARALVAAEARLLTEAATATRAGTAHEPAALDRRSPGESAATTEGKATGSTPEQRGQREMTATGQGAGSGHLPVADQVPASTHQWRALQGSDTEIAALATKIQPLAGTVDVLVHGTVDHFLVVRGGSKIEITHRDLARYLQQNGGIPERVRLISCRAGQHPKGAAQHLANKLGVPVLAATDLVHIDRATGALTVGPNPDSPTGTWIEYTPRRSESRGTPYRERMSPETRYERFLRERAEHAGSPGATVAPPTDGATHDPAASDARRRTPDADSGHSTDDDGRRTMGEAEHGPRATTRQGDDHTAARARAAEVMGSVVVQPVRRPSGAIDYHITQAEGQVILAAIRDLDGMSALPYPDGLIVRDGDQEWFFDYRAPRATAQQFEPGPRGDLGLPPANVGTIELWALRGMRWIQKPGESARRGRDQWTPDEAALVARLLADLPLLDLGHVMVSFDGGRTMYGFTPDQPRTTDHPDGIPVAAFLERLRQHEVFPGVVKDDTDVATWGRRMALEHGWNTMPERVTELFTPEQKAKIGLAVNQQRVMDAGAHGLGYSLPLKEAEAGQFYRGGTVGERTYEPCNTGNCARYPELLGIPIPEASGNLRDYMPKLREWAEASAPIDARDRGDER